jgi:hypothetical protein
LFYEHFKTILGLCGKGFDPRKSSVDAYATEAECVKLWGLHKGHNGFKWKVDGNLLEIESIIKKFNNVIYQRGQKNSSIFLAFVKGIVAKSKGIKVN